MSLHVLQLEADETIITIVHRHWLTLFTKLFGITMFALTPLFAWAALLATQRALEDTSLHLYAYSIHFTFLYSTWLLFATMAVAFAVSNHYLDVWALTNKRIITIDQQGFFRRNIGSFRLDKLQDINIEIHGFIATLLDYGTVEAETASESSGEFRAYNLPNPRGIKELILKAADELDV
jgi:hypothetical protein